MKYVYFTSDLDEISVEERDASVAAGHDEAVEMLARVFAGAAAPNQSCFNRANRYFSITTLGKTCLLN